MTRDEIIEYYTHLLERREKNSQIVDDSFVKDSLTDLFESVIRELKQRQPDAETGLVPCGCGGKPTFLYSYVARDDECYLECTRCEAKSALRLGEERARDSWNTAMGWREKG